MNIPPPANSAPPALDIDAEDLRVVRAILRRWVPGLRVVAYGSRTRGRARKFSDLDLAVVAEQPVGVRTMALLADDFTRSNLPMRVDLAEWRDFSADFRAAVAADCVAVQNEQSPGGS